jgi:hypothetical protein
MPSGPNQEIYQIYIGHFLSKLKIAAADFEQNSILGRFIIKALREQPTNALQCIYRPIDGMHLRFGYGCVVFQKGACLSIRFSESRFPRTYLKNRILVQDSVFA